MINIINYNNRIYIKIRNKNILRNNIKKIDIKHIVIITNNFKQAKTIINSINTNI